MEQLFSHSKIVLATANARYSHCSFSLRYLMANLGDLAGSARIAEFTIDQRPLEIAETLIGTTPTIIGFSVYLWNVTLLTDVVELIKKIRPGITIILGGPEVSFETDSQRIAELADYVVTGEGENAMRSLCESILAGNLPTQKIINGGVVELASISVPYDLYTDEDIAHRVIYVEASRGCPHGCEFCLSSLDTKVRRFDEQLFLDSIKKLWQRGVRRFKFVDRALHIAVGPRLLELFLELDKTDEGLFLHFELIPDRLPEKLAQLLCKFRAGAVQVEAGIQTLNEEVAARINRRQNLEKSLGNLQYLSSHTGVHVHSDLVVGLPGETLEVFAKGFNRLLLAGPEEIQVGILKRLRGAPIARHDEKWQMKYNPKPPYDILENSSMNFETMQRMKRFSRYFDLVCNSGNFRTFAPLLWKDTTPFDGFIRFSDWLFEKTHKTGSIALKRLIELAFNYARENCDISHEEAANRLFADAAKGSKRGFPQAVLDHVTKFPSASAGPSLPPRQKRHAK